MTTPIISTWPIAEGRFEAMAEALAYGLCERDGNDDPHHLIWEGSPPEPWGEVWQKYIPEAEKLLSSAIAMEQEFQLVHDTMQAVHAASEIEDPVTVPRSLLGSACSAIDFKRDAPKTLEQLRRYTVGDLSGRATPTSSPDEPAHGQLDPRRAMEFGREIFAYAESFNGQKFDSVFDSPDRQNLAMALDHLTEAGAMLMNLAERVSGKTSASGVWPVSVQDELLAASKALVNCTRMGEWGDAVDKARAAITRAEATP